ncbi:MAG: hypothetical protein ACTSRU_13930 [Candidatus Hodarchaeales archaeon]
MTDKEIYKAVVFDGASVDCNGVSLCNLENVLYGHLGVPRAKYQVWSDKNSFHALYQNVDEAVAKFVELKGRGQ